MTNSHGCHRTRDGQCPTYVHRNRGVLETSRNRRMGYCDGYWTATEFGDANSALIMDGMAERSSQCGAGFLERCRKRKIPLLTADRSTYHSNILLIGNIDSLDHSFLAIGLVKADI